MRPKEGLLIVAAFLAIFVTVAFDADLYAESRPDSVILRVENSLGYVGKSGGTRIMMRSSRLLAAISVPLSIDDPRLIIDSVSAAYSIAGPYIPLVGFFSDTLRCAPVRLLPDLNGHEFNSTIGELFRVCWHIRPDATEGVAAVDSCFYPISISQNDTIYERINAADWGLHNFTCSFFAGSITISRYECGNFNGDPGWDWYKGSDSAASRESVLGSYEGGNVREADLVDLPDVLYFMYYIFGGGRPPLDKSYGDVNCDGMATISDVVYLLNYIFKGGTAPCAGCPVN